MAAAPPDDDWRRRARRRFLVPLVLLVIGVAIVLVTDGVAYAVGWGVIGLALVGAVSLLFLEVGLSEDRARERERRP
jgi:hypothetical protein